MQYAGLKDKNGKEIYEGDILGYWGKAVWEIGWNENKAGWYAIYNEDKVAGLPAFKITQSNVSRKEVIGNIYENHDLLTKK